MKFFTTAFLAMVLLTIESVLVKYLGLSVARIDVTVVLLAFLALRASLLEGALSAFFVGYLVDLLSGQPTGLYTFLGVAVFLLGRLAESLVDVRSPSAFCLFAMAMDGVHVALAFFFTWMVSKEWSWGGAGFGSFVLQIFLTGVAALMLFPLLRKLEADQERPRAGLLD